MKSTPNQKSNPNLGPSIIPHLWYPNPKAAVSFLEKAFDFHADFPSQQEESLPAEINIGRGCILIGQANTPKYMFHTPREAGGLNTGAPYIATSDVDALYQRAKKAGADMVRDLADTDYGSRDFSARDPDGYLWNFGTYHPTIDGSDGNSSPEAEVFEALRYERPRTAMNWLIEALGFEEHSVVPGNSGSPEDIPHALLRFGNSLLMVSGTRRDDPLKMMPPQQLSQGDIGGTHTQVIYVVVADPDAHFEQAKAADAEVLENPTDTLRGGRQYLIRDPEGYLWCFTSHGRTSHKEAVTSATAESPVVQA